MSIPVPTGSQGPPGEGSGPSSSFPRGPRSRGGRRGMRRGGPGGGLADWTPLTKLGRLVKAEKISLPDVFRFGLPIKEPQIVDKFFATGTSLYGTLKDEVMKVSPVQKQTTAGQRTRFKAFVAVGNEDGYVGLGSKCSSEVATAIQGAIRAAKMALVPVRRGYWGNKLGQPHTVPMKVHGKCGSVRVRLIPAPRGTGIVGAPVTKKMLQFAGIKDCFTNTTGHSRTRGNFMYACYYALARTYAYLTPELWEAELVGTQEEIEARRLAPFETHAEFLLVHNNKKH